MTVFDSPKKLQSYIEHLAPLHRELRILPNYGIERGLPLHEEAKILVDADEDPNSVVIKLTPDAATAWNNMKTAANRDNIELILEYGFRSLDIQAQLIRDELSAGSTLEKALTWIAAPGYSEHHTGRAIDIASPDCFPATSKFANTDAFKWLDRNANKFGFYLSYPPNNQHGIIYEPWHWCLKIEK